MSLTAADIAEIMKLVEDSHFDELQLETNGLKLTLRRGGGVGAPATAPAAAAAAAPAPAHAPRVAAPAQPPAPAPAPAAAPATARPPAAGEADVLSPMLGTFYRAPRPGAPPFVEPGAVVDEDTVIGIIEVMKLMNTVTAGVRGRITEIFGRDGTLVEYGEPLLRVTRAD